MEPAGAETPVLHGLEHCIFACDFASTGKGLAVFAPETANATTPYQVSPVLAVVTEMVSVDRVELDIAYQVCTKLPPPMEYGESLGEKVRPDESLTENAVPDGQQLQPTIMTSFDWVVVNETLQVVTYPHPPDAEPSILRLLAVEEEVLEVVTVEEEVLEVVTVEEEVLEVVTVEEEVLEVVTVEEEVLELELDGLIASTTTPKSLPCAVPNESVAEDRALESTSN